MTIKNIIQHPGLGGVKNAFDRFHQNAPMDQGYYGGPNGYNGGPNGYNYPQPNYHAPQGGQMFKHYSFSQSSGGHKGAGGAAMSALTLLSFLFFLNILQQCLKDHMMTLNPQVTLMTAGREELQSKDVEIKTDTKILETDKRTLGKGIGRAYPSELNEDAKDVVEHEIRFDVLNLEQSLPE